MIWRSSRLALLCQTCNECEAFKTIKKPKCAGPFCILMSLQIFIFQIKTYKGKAAEHFNKEEGVSMVYSKAVSACRMEDVL